jgi:ABC-type Fe3+ transport system substrate-binding protein
MKPVVTSIAVALAIGLGLTGAGYVPGQASAALPREETKSLNQLYQDAIAEGGQLIVYAGGDTVDQQDANANAFRARFPEIKLTMSVDYSKFQDARVDLQLASHTLVPDVVQLQEVQDFDRWKSEGVLQPYFPAGFSKVYNKFKDPGGAWIGIVVNAFSNVSNPALTGEQAPSTAEDYLDPRWKAKIVVDYPNDDDATEFLFKKEIDKYGWQWLTKFLAQEPKFVRGGQAPVDEVAGGQMPVAFGVAGSLRYRPGDTTKFSIPKSDPFMAWAQRAAMFKQTKHPAAASLYLNWWLSKLQQQNLRQWPTRTDVAPADEYRPIWEYPNAYVDEFPQMMADRGAMERLRSELTQYIGEPQGPPSAGVQGLYPGKDGVPPPKP